MNAFWHSPPTRFGTNQNYRINELIFIKARQLFVRMSNEIKEPNYVSVRLGWQDIFQGRNGR